MSVELTDLLPDGWRLLPAGGAIRLIAPDCEEARDLIVGSRRSLQSCAERLQHKIEVWAADGCRPLLSIRASQEPPRDTSKPIQDISSYSPTRIAPDASYESICDFMRGKRAEGLIVTVTSMVSDKCLMINDLQVADRGRWTADDWTGIDFKQLWRDSFLQGRTNYYADLIARVQRDSHIPEFHYQIRRPSGALAEYSSTYHLVQNFCGIPARIAVSRVGDWRIVEGEE